MGMKYFMPEICYHERNSLLSVDIFPYSQDGHYRIVTSSTKSEIRIWEFEYDPNDPEQISITFVANLVGHCGTVNQVKFSPNPAAPLLASGDAHGALIVWQLVDKECDAHPIDGLPQNRERWTNKKKYFLDNMGVNAISWSPCGKSLACVSGDGLRVLDALSGSYRFVLTSFRYFPNGVTYDPEGKYIVVMSTDRRLDIICADKGRRIKSFGRADMPEFSLGDAHFAKKNYSLFHSDLLTTFTRVPAFSPCGQILVAPAGCLELGPSQQFYCTYVFKVSELKEEDHPKIILPSPNQPTFLIKFCPIIYELVPDCPNYSGLPHRVIWLAMSREEIVFYDSQHAQAIGLIQNITYHCLSDAAWSKDGTTIAVSDMEEYMHFISFTLEEGVVRTEKIRSSYELPVSDRGEATEKVSSPEFDAEAALLDLSIQPYVSPSLSPEHDEEKLSGSGEETPTIEIRNCCFENNDELTHQKVRNSLIVITKNLERTRSKVEEMKANCYDLINDSYLEF